MLAQTFPGHECAPIPVVFGLSLAHTSQDLWHYDRAFTAMRRNGLDPHPVSWEGVDDVEAMIREMDEATDEWTIDDPCAPPVIEAGHSAGAYSALLAAGERVERGAHNRMLGVIALSPSPWFEEDRPAFLSEHAVTDEDFTDPKMRYMELAKLNEPGPPVPNIPMPVMVFWGRSEGEFIESQALSILDEIPSARGYPIPGALHPIRLPRYAAALALNVERIFNQALEVSKQIDRSKLVWRTQPQIAGVRFAYTGTGAALIWEPGESEPKIMNLANFACLMTRIRDGDSAPMPSEDSDLDFRYDHCRRPINREPLGEEVIRHVRQLAFNASSLAGR